MLDKLRKLKLKVKNLSALSTFSIFKIKISSKVNFIYKLLGFRFNLFIKDIKSDNGRSVLSINSFKFYNYLF